MKDYREYNTKYHPLICRTEILMGHPFNNALQKSNSYDEAVKNLEILGWDDEWKKFILEAVNFYSEHLKANAPESKNDNRKTDESLSEKVALTYFEKVTASVDALADFVSSVAIQCTTNTECEQFCNGCKEYFCNEKDCKNFLNGEVKGNDW